MRNLAIVVANAWFWFLFIGLGPSTSTAQIIVGAATLLAGCLLFALWGALAARRPGIGVGAPQAVRRPSSPGVDPRNDC